MNNKYLEKIALNRFEKHLSKNPPNTTKAMKNIMGSPGEFLHHYKVLKATENKEWAKSSPSNRAAYAHEALSTSYMKDARGTGNDPILKFKNTGDSLNNKGAGFRRAQERNRLQQTMKSIAGNAQTEVGKSSTPSALSKLKNYVTKNPGKAGLVGAGVLAAGYGAKKLSEK